MCVCLRLLAVEWLCLSVCLLVKVDLLCLGVCLHLLCGGVAVLGACPLVWRRGCCDQLVYSPHVKSRPVVCMCLCFTSTGHNTPVGDCWSDDLAVLTLTSHPPHAPHPTHAHCRVVQSFQSVLPPNPSVACEEV